MKNKKHIAMRCTQEQFEAIKPKLEKAGEIGELRGAFIKYKYLTNNFGPKMDYFDFIGNDSYWEAEHGNNIHEEWNEKIFLEACGIETIPTLEEVKEYFKYAETVEYFTQESEQNISSPKGKGIHYAIGSYWIEAEGVTGRYTKLWDKEQGYAKILTYKTPKFEITKSQLEQLHRQGNDYTKFDLEYLFPLAFKEEKKELQKDFTGWVLDEESSKLIAYSEKGLLKYGFDFHEKWIEDTNVRIKNERKATPEEVTEALKKEAVRRYKVGDLIKNFEGYCNGETNNMLFGGEYFCIDSDGSFCVKSTNNFWIRIMSKEGIWATVIQTKTIQEAEELLKELGHEIKIVS